MLDIHMNNTSEYFISQLKNPVSVSELDNLFYRVDTMSYDDICSLYRDLRNHSEKYTFGDGPRYDWEAINRLLRHIKSVKTKLEGGNKPIKQLINDNKSACCEDAAAEIADELYDRFKHQSFEDQRLIMKTLIKPDPRDEAYYLLDDVWGKMFVKELQRHWLKCGDTQPIEYIIKFSSEEFLLIHLDDLTTSGIVYMELCLRLANNPLFVIDEHRFSNRRHYYAILYKLGRGVDGEYFTRELFKAIENALMTFSKHYVEHLYRFEYRVDSDSLISAKLFPEVHDAIWAMQYVGIKDEVFYFYDWDSNIIRQLREFTKTWQEEKGEEMPFYEMWSKYRELAIENFPAEYAMLIKKKAEENKQKQLEMVEQLRPFMEELDLEWCDTPF